MTPGLTVVLGAGVSQGLGIAGTRSITEAADAALDGFGTVYSDLRDRLVKRFGDRYNFEILAGALEACEPFGYPGFFPTALYDAVQPAIAVLHDGLTVELARAMYEGLIGTVVSHASVDVNVSAAPDAIARMRALFDQLAYDHRLRIVTLNYDLSDESFVPNAIDGFGGAGDYETFDSRRFLLGNDAAPRIAHLHGSIRFGVTEAGAAFVKTPGSLKPRRVPLWMPRMNGSIYTGLITGEDKAGKLMLTPYSFYYAWFAEQLLRSPRILVAGYGVGDVHVNAWLANAARHHVGPDFRIVIVDYFDLALPPDGVMSLFAIGAGFEHGIAAEPALRGLHYDDGVAVHAGAMLVRTGMPLSDSQRERVAAFLAS